MRQKITDRAFADESEIVIASKYRQESNIALQCPILLPGVSLKGRFHL
jgi:hypothetical protein